MVSTNRFNVIASWCFAEKLSRNKVIQGLKEEEREDGVWLEVNCSFHVRPLVGAAFGVKLQLSPPNLMLSLVYI